MTCAVWATATAEKVCRNGPGRCLRRFPRVPVSTAPLLRCHRLRFMYTHRRLQIVIVDSRDTDSATGTFTQLRARVAGAAMHNLRVTMVVCGGDGDDGFNRAIDSLGPRQHAAVGAVSPHAADAASQAWARSTDPSTGRSLSYQVRGDSCRAHPA